MENKRTNICIRLDAELKEKLGEIAEELDTTISDVARTILIMAINNICKDNKVRF